MRLEIHPPITTLTSLRWKLLSIVPVSLLVAIATLRLVQHGLTILSVTDPMLTLLAMVGTTSLTLIAVVSSTKLPKLIHMLMHFLHGGTRIYIALYRSSESQEESPLCPPTPGGLLTGLKSTRARVLHAWLSIVTWEQMSTLTVYSQVLKECK